MVTLLTNDINAQIECRESPELNLRGLIDSRKKDLQGKEEFQEELDYYIEIENLCFGTNPDPSDIEANR